MREYPTHERKHEIHEHRKEPSAHSLLHLIGVFVCRADYLQLLPMLEFWDEGSFDSLGEGSWFCDLLHTTKTFYKK